MASRVYSVELLEAIVAVVGETTVDLAAGYTWVIREIFVDVDNGLTGGVGCYVTINGLYIMRLRTPQTITFTRTYERRDVVSGPATLAAGVSYIGGGGLAAFRISGYQLTQP